MPASYVSLRLVTVGFFSCGADSAAHADEYLVAFTTSG